MKEKNKSFIFFALAKTGEGMSGGDRIFMELGKRIGVDYPIEIFTSYEGLKLCQEHKITAKKLKIILVNNRPFQRLFLLNYIYKIVLGIKLGLTYKIPTSNNLPPSPFMYSASEFWMDSLPALIIKLRYPKLKWVAAWYQTAPNPLIGFKEGARNNSYRFSAFLYWLMQVPIKPLIKKYADFVIVNNEDERKQFPMMNKAGKVIVLIGAVPLGRIKKYITAHNPQHTTKIYDAVFQGRFHPQKGVGELVGIWKKVVNKIPDAKLAMVGDGPLRKSVELRIKNHGLEDNVKLFGYVFDGLQKYKIFSQSKIVVHPAFYDSGGMAAAEAMAFGLPCVGFNLKSYISYYPKGMVKVKIGESAAFADAIIRLLSDKRLRAKIGREAENMIKESWSWKNRTVQLLEKIMQ
jgi:glycosyltransferase involved in cell wall biosynthesis